MEIRLPSVRNAVQALRMVRQSMGPRWARVPQPIRRSGIKRGRARPGLGRALSSYLTACVVLLAIVLGGATRAGFLGDAVLQLMALPLLWFALIGLFESRETSRVRWVLSGLVVVVALPLLQLVPLPPSIWTSLPGRSAITGTYELLGDPLPAFPLTVSPEATWLSALSLVPAVAIFLSVLTLGYEQRRHVSLVIVAVAVVSVFLGLLQVAGGPNSGLRFYTVTNTSEAVGFFANRNHFAALLYVAMLFCFCWLFETSETLAEARAAKFDSKTVIYFAVFAVAFIVLMAGQLMARSRAGLLLSIGALIAGFIIVMKGRRARGQRYLPKFLLAAIAIVVAACSPFALFRILDRFGTEAVSDARVAIVRNTISAAEAYMPFGSGLGTFVPVYQTFEKPSDIAVTYVNHAHNDLLELWVETGIPGLLLLSVCVVWLARRAIAAWTPAAADDARRIDRDLTRSAAVVIGLLLAHSLVDYPLRTSANLAVFAFAAGLLVPPLRARREDPGMVEAKSRTVPYRSFRASRPVRQRALWYADGEWPSDRN